MHSAVRLDGQSRAYTSMYYLLGRMWLGKKSWRLWIFLIAGVADVLENCVLLKTAQACYDYADTVVAYWTSNFSKTKWLFLGLNSSLVARLFWIWPKPGWQFTEALTACAYQVAGALLLSGLAYPDNIERGLPLLSLGVILQLTIFGAINRSLQNISLVKTDVY